MKNRIFFALLLLCVCFSCASCIIAQTPENTNVPYIISRPVCSVGEKEGYYYFTGIDFAYLNITEKIVSKINISFMVFDAVTQKNPFIGSNTIKVSFDGTIQSGEKKDLVISLDPYTYVAPSVPYLIDFFYIARVEFSDGSSWEDRYGTYFTKSY